MWIELPDEMENYICKIKNADSKEADLINDLLTSMRKGKHIVFLSRHLIDILSNLKYINQSNKEYFKWVKDHYTSIYVKPNILDFWVKVVVNKDKVTLNEECYEVPLKCFVDCSETKLLTENETDGKFFENIYYYIMENKSTWFTIKFENDSCHGSNVGSKIEQVAKRNRFAICILDSDQEMKNSKKGDTYKCAKKVLKELKNEYFICLETLRVREKENLFPPSIYTLFCEDKKGYLEVLEQFEDNEKIMGFFDIKDGVKYKKHRQKVWHDYYEKVIKRLRQKKLYKLPKNRDVKDDFVCIEGIGDKLCDEVVKAMLENKCSFKTKQNKVSEINKSLLRTKYEGRKFLPIYMEKEWKRISKLLFSWGCCIDTNMHKPVYEI